MREREHQLPHTKRQTTKNRAEKRERERCWGREGGRKRGPALTMREGVKKRDEGERRGCQKSQPAAFRMSHLLFLEKWGETSMTGPELS